MQQKVVQGFRPEQPGPLVDKIYLFTAIRNLFYDSLPPPPRKSLMSRLPAI